MENNFIFAYTISGDGYSEPVFKLFNDKEEAETERKHWVEGLDHEEFDEAPEDSEHTREDNSRYFKNSNDDYHRLRIMEVDPNPFILIKHTEPNEVDIITGGQSLHSAMYFMKQAIKREKWQRGEEEYDGESHSYGAHATDGYIHFEILTLEKDEPVNNTNDFVVEIVFGEDDSRKVDESGWDTKGTSIVKKTFNTEAERSAYIEGVEDMDGYLAYSFRKLELSTLGKSSIEPFTVQNLRMPDRKFDTLEIHPCWKVGFESGKEIIEQCHPDNAEFWSVFAHLVEGGLECIADLETQKQALDFVTLFAQMELFYERKK